MANEITTTLFGSNGGLVAEFLSASLLAQLFDPTDLRSLMIFMPWNPSGAGTMKVTQDAVPGAFTATTNQIDGSNVTNSAYTTSEFGLTPTRHKRQYQATDLMPIAGGVIGADMVGAIANKLDQGVALTMTDLLCNLFPSLSTSKGSSGSPLSVDNMYESQFALNLANAVGPYAAVLYNKQMNDLRDDLRNETGAQQFVPATAELLATKGPGYQLSWNGIDFYQSDSVTAVDASANSAGAMFAAGCFGYTLADPRLFQQHIPASNLILANEALLLELVRDADNGMSSILGQMYPSVVEIEDARGVKIVTDR
jgi:hypothetical protein